MAGADARPSNDDDAPPPMLCCSFISVYAACFAACGVGD
jgi:hypothetical protein